MKVLLMGCFPDVAAGEVDAVLQTVVSGISFALETPDALTPRQLAYMQFLIEDVGAEEQIELASGEVDQAAINEMSSILREMVTALRREQGQTG